MTLDMKALSWIFYVAAFVLLGKIGVEAYYNFMPPSYWVEYESVTPIKTEFKVNERLKFISRNNIKRRTNLLFHDVLFCKNDQGDWERYGDQTTGNPDAARQLNRVSVWPFSPGVNHPTECYLRSGITVLPKLAEPKSFTYDGLANNKVFKIVE